VSNTINRRMRRAARRHLGNSVDIGTGIALISMLALGWVAIFAESAQGVNNVIQAETEAEVIVDTQRIYVPRIITETETVEVIKEVPVAVEIPTPVIEYVETTTEVPVPTDQLPACLYDEVTEVNCIWDASTQGNGQGRSFIAYNGVAYYSE
jgi:hypothetical protein